MRLGVLTTTLCDLFSEKIVQSPPHNLTFFEQCFVVPIPVIKLRRYGICYLSSLVDSITYQSISMVSIMHIIYMPFPYIYCIAPICAKHEDI